jgi:hypothetical protein
MTAPEADDASEVNEESSLITTTNYFGIVF